MVLQATRVVVLTYALVEEAGGPSVAATGFARVLSRQGADVHVYALRTAPDGHWLIDEETAHRDGFVMSRLGGTSLARNLTELLLRVGRDRAHWSALPTVVWVNGIWGGQSAAAAVLGKLYGWPVVVRPAGSLGDAALRYHRSKKQVYYRLVEGPALRRAAALHCMSARELAELPTPLRAKAFVVPTGIDVPALAVAPTPTSPPVIGLLARIHPIKRQLEALIACERLVSRGLQLHVELAGSVSDQAYEKVLREKVSSSPWLRGRVRFLGHISPDQLGPVVGNWTAALLLSEQENFGHAVLTAAAFGVPTVVAPGVALADELASSGAGRVAKPAQAEEQLADLLHAGAAIREKCIEFARGFSWPRVGYELAQRLANVVRTARDRS